MILRWRDATTLAVESEGLTPEALLGLEPSAVARRLARIGNRDAELGDVFTVEADGTEILTFEGDCRHVRGIGRGMTSGTLHVRGTAGAYLAAGMSGGRVEVFGTVGDWAASALAGGMVWIHGDAGRALGAAAPGARVGMKDGVVLVDGSVGAEAGSKLRRGLIAVGGTAGAGFGRGLIAGTLLAGGAVGRDPGLGMKRGTIILLGPEPPILAPTFMATGSYRMPFLTIYFRRLAAWGFRLSDDVGGAGFARYNGDRAERGIGEILHATATI